jgi:CheY-like chemotaxis protein
MPKLSGYRFHQKIKARREWMSIPTLIVTGHARDDLGKDDFEKVTQLGNCAYLEKPIKPEQYLSAVRQLLGMDVDAGGAGT